MAEKKNNTRKSSSNKKGKQTEGVGKLKFAIVVMAALIILLLVYIVSSSKRNAEPDAPQVTPTTIVFATNTPAPTATPVATSAPVGPTSTPVPTESAAVTPSATSTPAPTEAGTEATGVKVSLESAQKIVNKNIDTSLYEASIVNDHLGINGVTYYAFQVKDKNSGSKYEQLLIVNVDTGSLKVFADNEVVDFVKFPLDNAKAPDSGNVAGAITPEQAYAILCKYDKDSLNLAKNVSEYKYRTDGNITTINGTKQCYAIELYEISNGKERNRGTFYVSTDGLDVFYIDELTGTFVPVTLG